MMNSSVFDFTVVDANGASVSLKKYAGQVVLIVNVASKCGFTPQYEGLEKLYKKYKDKNFTILGFPCNQFGGQEPGSNQEIQEFCSLTYGVNFPILGKVDVNGDKTDPLYKYLKSTAPGILGTQGIKWNFTKFLIGKNGQVIERFAPQTKPEDLSDAIEAALGH